MHAGRSPCCPLFTSLAPSVHARRSFPLCRGYANRLSYLLNRIFQCEFSGKSNLDYFSALESEKAESRIVRERFPDELKGRVLHTVQFRE